MIACWKYIVIDVKGNCSCQRPLIVSSIESNKDAHKASTDATKQFGQVMREANFHCVSAARNSLNHLEWRPTLEENNTTHDMLADLLILCFRGRPFCMLAPFR